MSPGEPEHECLFQPWQVDYARTQARREPRQPPVLRPCVICGMPVDLVAVARERLEDQARFP